MVGQDVIGLKRAGLDTLHQFPGVLEFPPAAAADPASPLLDGEHTAQSAVMTPKQRLKYQRYRFPPNDLSKQTEETSMTDGESAV